MKALQEDIRSGSLKHVYLLCGEEPYLVRQYRGRLKSVLAEADDTMNVSEFEGKDINVKEVIDLAETMPFFAERRVILITDSGLFRRGSEELAEYMGEIPDTTYFVFAEKEIDRRGRLYKQVKKFGRVVELKRQPDDVLMQWILSRLKKEGKKITRPVMELFLSKTGDRMDQIEQELEKLFSYTAGREVIGAGDVEAVCSNQISGKIFDMVDAMAAKQQKRALELYYDLLALKEPPMRILFLMVRQFQILMQLKEMAGQGFDYRHMASHVKVPEFAVRKYTAQAGRFSSERLLEAVRDGVRAEEDVKTGKLADRLAVELFLVRYSG